MASNFTGSALDARSVSHARDDAGAVRRSLASVLADAPYIDDWDGDDSTKAQAAIDWGTAQAHGATIKLANRTYEFGDVILKDQVRLVGDILPVYPQSSLGPMTRIDVGAGASWAIDTPLTDVSSAALIGLSFVGGGAAAGHGGVRFQSARSCGIQSCSFDQMDEQAILVDSGGTSMFMDIKAQNCLLDRVRAGKSGVIQLSGSDNWILRGEYTASSSLEGDISSANLYVCAIALIGIGGNNWVQDCVGEISDIGLYVEGAHHKISGVRCDLNYAHGYQIASDTSLFTGNHAYRNGRSADATYNDFDVIAGSSSNILTGNLAVASVGDANRTNYAFADIIATDGNKNYYTGNRGFDQRAGTYDVNGTKGGAITVSQGPNKSFADLDATPSVDNYASFRWYSPSAFTVTNFDDGVPGQIINVINVSNNDVTVANNSTIATLTGAAKALVQNTVYQFYLFSGKWYELGSVAAAAVAGPAGGATIDAEARTAIDAIIANLQASGTMK